MKKTYLYIAMGLLLTGCNLDINEDPNYPSNSTVTTDLILPSAENYVADCLGDQMFNYGAFFSQYFAQAPGQTQYQSLDELNVDEGSDLFNRCYRNLYAGALTDIKAIMDETTNTADIYACTVLRAQAFQLLVDNMSDAPYTEALQASSNANPKWDDGQAIFEGILAELDEAEAKLSTSDVMTLTDPMLNKDIKQWKGYANALRLRIYLRMIDGGINASEYTSKAVALVNSDEFFTGDVTWDVYSNAEGQYNPWYATYRRLGTNHCASYPIVSYLMQTNDPRISYSFLPRKKDATYVGEIPGCRLLMGEWLGIGASFNNEYVSAVNYDNASNMSIYMFTQSELQFLIAEVQLRFNNNENAAKTAYELGVTTDFTSRGAAGVGTFLSSTRTGWNNQSTTTDKLNLIYMQKWVALLFRDHMEAWSEIRRTDVPVLSSISAKKVNDDPTAYTAGELIEPGINYINAGGLAKRVPYPSSARSLNKNTPAAKLLSDKVFWDVK